MTVIGEMKKPRILACGFNRDHDFAQVLERYAGSVHYLADDPDVRIASYDAAVALGELNISGSGLYVIQIGGSPIGSLRTSNGSSSALTIGESLGLELKIPDELPDQELRELVKRELIAVVDPAIHKRRITPYRLAAGKSIERYCALLKDLDNYAFGAIYRPDFGPTECLYLPETIRDLGPWLLYAFKRWAAELPDVFPSQPDWVAKKTWMTPQEEQAAADLAAREAEMAAIVAETQRTVDEAAQALSIARESGDQSDRLLLTGEGDPLVAEVKRALEDIGFAVRDMDAELSEGQPRREDLRPELDGWTAICEVKGYSRGAKASDLGLFPKYTGLYVQEIGAMPDALWYVVNQFRFDIPDSRPLPLAGHDDEVHVFASQPGLVIDTRDLYRLRKAVVLGTIDGEEARRLLMESTGRFAYLEN